MYENSILKIIESFDHATMHNDWRTQYRRYRAGRLKHQYWLWNRKSPDHAMIDEYDHLILRNCQSGNTVFFSSAGYYLKDLFPEIIVVEQFPIVKSFYPDVVICQDRSQLPELLDMRIDNFAMVNNRAEMWTTVDGLTEHLSNYVKIMNPGCRVFYSFRDTQMWVNRLTTDLEKYFKDWAKSLEMLLGLKLVWQSVDFSKKIPQANGTYDVLENPDTTNGNLKFWFVYQGDPWTVVE